MVWFMRKSNQIISQYIFCKLFINGIRMLIENFIKNLHLNIKMIVKIHSSCENYVKTLHNK